jgi:hypothetical protein
MTLTEAWRKLRRISRPRTRVNNPAIPHPHTFTGLAKRLPTLPEDRERPHGIRPPPAEGGVEPDAEEQGQREVGADPRLRRVGDQRSAPHLPARAPLEVRKDRHDDERDGGEHNRHGRTLRSLARDESANGLVDDVESQEEERGPNQLKRLPLGGPLLGNAGMGTSLE